MTLKVLDLFSGIGGFSLGLERAGMNTVAFCEIDPYCRKILNRHWPQIPVFPDIRTLTANDLPAKPDLVCGGYPCQPFSVAGKRRGKADDRHLWPEMFRLVQECRPDWVIGENVAGHVRLGLDEVLSDLESAGYTSQPLVVPACAVNAPHRRDRVWIIAHRQRQPLRDATGENHQPLQPVRPVPGCHGGNGAVASHVGDSQHDGLPATPIPGRPEKAGQRPQEGTGTPFQPARAGGPADPEIMANRRGNRVSIRLPKADTGQERHTKKPNHKGHRLNGWQGSGIWSTEPAVGRVADGIPDRVDRIKALGNALVPQIPELFGRFILQVTDEP